MYIVYYLYKYVCAQLCRYNDHMSYSISEILSGMFRFFVDSKYMFVSKKNYTTSGNVVS